MRALTTEEKALDFAYRCGWQDSTDWDNRQMWRRMHGDEPFPQPEPDRRRHLRPPSD